MNPHERKDRHVKLHKHLDELAACFIVETGLLPSIVTLMEFMEWSHEMTKEPTCIAKRAKE